jgi:hypothetical protein
METPLTHPDPHARSRIPKKYPNRSLDHSTLPILHPSNTPPLRYSTTPVSTTPLYFASSGLKLILGAIIAKRLCKKTRKSKIQRRQRTSGRRSSLPASTEFTAGTI